MTSLQSLAMERIQTLNSEMHKLIPRRINEQCETINVPTTAMTDLRNKICEQDAWIHALIEEDKPYTDLNGDPI